MAIFNDSKNKILLVVVAAAAIIRVFAPAYWQAKTRALPAKETLRTGEQCMFRSAKVTAVREMPMQPWVWMEMPMQKLRKTKTQTDDGL